MRPRFELATLLREQWPRIETSDRLSNHHKRMLKALAQCRTAALGGHLDACSDCGLVRISYNSCRNRHCPKCQGAQRQQWIADREEELLPLPYFHLVFTLPEALNPMALKHPRLIYGLLFQVAWQTIQAFARDHKHLGAQTAMVAILHTWGQNLSLHPHLHCIVPGGGLTPSGKWKMTGNKGKFLFPVKAMSKVFRAKFAQALRKAAAQKHIPIPDSLFKAFFARKWVIYAKRPFGGPKQVLEYLGRYTHKVAISNHRITDLDQHTISFSYKDYRQAGKKRIMTLDKQAFILRFARHILPPGFVRIRHYGFLASKTKRKALPLARKALRQIKTTPIDSTACQRPQPPSFDPLLCPCCGKKTMITQRVFLPQRAPPLPIPCS